MYECIELNSSFIELFTPSIYMNTKLLKKDAFNHFLIREATAIKVKLI